MKQCIVLPKSTFFRVLDHPQLIIFFHFPIKGFQRAKYTLVAAKDYVYNVAHLITALNPGKLTGSRFFQIAGRFRFNLGPVFGTSTKLLQVKCGEPKCGFAINDGYVAYCST